jgi:hypothetical protein
MVHGRARAPSRQTMHVASNEVVGGYPHMGPPPVIFSNGKFYKGRGHITVVPSPHTPGNYTLFRFSLTLSLARARARSLSRGIRDGRKERERKRSEGGE